MAIAKIIKEDSYNIRGDMNGKSDNDDIFEIDELLAPTIQILNRKGYITYISCAGHPILDKFCVSSHANFLNGNIVSYIAFNPEIYLPEIQLPPNFTIYKRFLDWTNDERVYIRRKYDGDNVYKIMRDIVESMEQLYEWALGLPDFKDI